MSYPVDGRNHHKAINSEINLIEYKSQIEKIFKKEVKDFIHLGGTKNKIDVRIVFEDGSNQDISLKSKKNIKKGSFDWVNTTNFNKESFVNSFKVFNNYKGKNNPNGKKLLEDTIKNELSNFDSEKLTQIFINSVSSFYKNDSLTILIIDEKTETLNLIVPEVFDLIRNGYKLFVQNGKGKTSCKVLFKNDKNNQIDLGLRIRLHLNNGWTKWEKGLESVLCLKFQQDSVYKLLK